MESGRGCCDGHLLCSVRVNGLIALDVSGPGFVWLSDFPVAKNVRRQRNLPNPIRHRSDRLSVGGRKTNHRRSVFCFAENLALKSPGGMFEDRADGQFLARLDQTPPQVGFVRHRQKKTLHVATGNALSKKACGQNGGIIAE